LNDPRSEIDDLLGWISAFFERKPWRAVVLILLIYVPAALEASRNHPLWHDELFTYWIAQAPSLGDMWSDLRTLDLNPPLVYLLTRMSFRLLGVSTLATRLPEMIGFLVALLAIFRFVRLRLGALFALFTVGLLLGSNIAPLSVDARPYTLMLGCLGIVLVGWQKAAGDSRPDPRSKRPAAGRMVSLGLVFFGVLGMLLSHIFAVLALASLLAAELWREYRNRAADWPMLTALCLPGLAIATYGPMLRNHGGAIYPKAFQPSGEKIFAFYIGSIERELVVLCLTALAVLILCGVRRLRAGIPNTGPAWFFTAPEWIVIIGLFVSPLVLLFHLMLSHGAFFDRYGAVESFAVAMLTAVLLARWTLRDGQPNQSAALIGSVIVLLISGLWTAIPVELIHHRLIPTVANSEPHPPPCQACEEAAALDPNIPLVDASGVAFVEMNQREPPTTLARLFYLTDPSASTQCAHANIFEQMPLLIARFHLAGHSEPYPVFIAQHPHFFVFGSYDYPEDWLLRKLVADHADVRVLGRVDDSYQNHELYEVTLVLHAR
jgi:hypothetical protein